MLDDGGNPRMLNMADFATNGLTSPSLDFGGVCPAEYGCAFAGINPNGPGMPLQYPIGRSVYNGLNLKLRQDVNFSLPGLRHANLQAAYSRSRFVSPGGSNPSYLPNNDQDFMLAGVDYRDPLAFTGPSALDRKHQFSFGGVLDLPWSFRAGVVSHFYSGLPVTLEAPNTGSRGR